MQTIESLLQSTLSENSEIRQNAELEIKKLSFEPEFALNLSIVSCLKISISIRQLSLVLLKSYIDSHWSLSCPGLVKSDIKSNILRGLDDPSSLLRVLFANVVSKIAHLDDLWLDLLPTIVSLLKGSNDQIHSSLLILIDFVEGDLAESHLPIIAPVLFPELSRIFNTPSIDPDQRARALQVLTEFIKTLFNLKDQHKNVTSQFVEPVFNQWIPLIIQELNSATTCLSVKIQCLESSTIFYQCFRKSIPKSVVPLYFESSVKNLIALEDNYQVILDSQESDTQLESFILSLFEFCFLVIYDSSLKPLLQDLSIFYKLILSYSRITQSQVSNWTLNLSDFVAEEEEVSFSFNLRRINEKLIDFIDEFPTCLKSLVSTFLLNLQDGLDNWKSVESCLFLIGNLSDSVIVANESKSIIDLGMFFQQVVLPCLSKHGRCFWFASRFSSVLPSALISNLITWGVEALSQKNHFLNVFVIKGIKLFIENTTVTQHIPQIIDSLSRVLSFSIESQDELITICLDTISTSLLKTNQVSIFESTIIPLLIKVWAKLSDDVLVAEIIHETMSLFIKSPNSNFIPDFLDFVCKLLDCGLINMTRVSNETVFDVSGVFIEKEHVFSMVPLSFDLLCDIIDNSAVVPASFVQVVFPIVIQILLVSDNISILQNGQMLLESLVNKHFNSLLNWIEPTSGKTGLDFIMQFVAKLLQPSDQENQGIHVGNLITRLIQRGGSSLAPILSDLLSAVATRLFTAKIPSFIQSLVMVFAHLIVREQFELDIIISFLMNLNHQGKNGLVEFISIWCEYHSSFIGYYDVKISSLALSKLYAKCDERVSGILVKGDIIATTRIITRSRAKTTPDQFTCVSFSIKVVKLLLGDFMNNNDIEPVKKSTGKKDSSDEDDDDEWQDDVYGIGNDLMGKMLNDDDVSDSRIGGSCFSDDPLYNYDIKEHINSFMKTCVNQNVGGIKAFSETDLTQVERETLHKICR